MDVENLIRRSVAGMEPPTYPGPEPGVLRLDANTNLIGRNPALDRAARRIAEIDFMGEFKGLENYLRVTVGRPERSDRQVAVLKEWKASCSR